MDEVVILGRDLPGLSDPLTAIDRIHVYRWTGNAFEPIPFQINEVRTWQLVDTISGCVPPNFNPEWTLCETNYAFDFASGSPGDDQFAGFDGNDEIVFMARDAGVEAPIQNWLPGDVGSSRYGIRIVDEKLEGEQIDALGTGWVYFFTWNESHAPEYGARRYVEWEAKGAASDPDRDEACRGADPVESRRLLACGWERGNASATTGQSLEPTLDLRWIGNWTLNRLRVRAAGNTGTPYGDLVDRAKIRLGPCDTLCESEEDWDVLGCPRFLGRMKYDPATGRYPIHGTRLAQGTLSGFATTRADRYFGTHLRTRIRLRVHEGVGPMRAHPDFLSGATPMNLWTSSYPADPSQGSPVPADVIDGNGSDHNPPGSYEPGGFNWNQFDSPTEGRFLVVTRETRPLLFSGSTVHHYSDSGASDGDPQEFETGRFGNAGVRWQGATFDMQDRVCSLLVDDPEYLWREVETSIYALPPGRHASTYIDWLKRPLKTYPRQESQNSVPPSPGPPCKPTLSPLDPNTGFSLTLTPSTTCPDTTAGYALYRADGAGAYVFRADIRGGGSWLDPAVRHGGTYHYRAFPFNSDGTYGSAADPVTVTVQDTTPPSPPSGVSAVPMSQGARIDWERSSSFDVVAYDVYASFYSGGPYQRINAQPIPVPTRTLTATAFDPTKVYYIVVKSIDSVGNESAFSDEAVVTPLP